MKRFLILSVFAALAGTSVYADACGDTGVEQEKASLDRSSDHAKSDSRDNEDLRKEDKK